MDKNDVGQPVGEIGVGDRVDAFGVWSHKSRSGSMQNGSADAMLLLAIEHPAVPPVAGGREAELR